MKRYTGRSAAILGFGRSGRAAAAFLRAQGAHVSVYTAAPPSKADRLHFDGIRFCVGDFPSRFSEEILVRSPAIRPDILPVAESVAAGAELTSEIELLFAHCAAPIVGITGSDGKTTTAALIARLLEGAGKRVFLGGNNGVPLLPQVAEMTPDDVAVAELSSFQLMTLRQSPKIAVITNITPNHLNWHTDMAEYVAAKRRIFERGAERLVINAASPACAALDTGCVPQVVRFSLRGDDLVLCDSAGERVLSVPDGFRLPGRHNRENLAAALAAADSLTALGSIDSALTDFYGVAHRLQYVDTVDGVKFYNSSIDTSPTRTAAALEALGGRPVVIVGGRGKGLDPLPLIEALVRRAKAVFLYGEAAPALQRALTGRVPVHRFAAFAAATYAAAAWARPGDTVLLSPAHTAFDQFRDFEERGERFCALVAEMKESARGRF